MAGHARGGGPPQLVDPELSFQGQTGGQFVGEHAPAALGSLNDQSCSQ